MFNDTQKATIKLLCFTQSNMYNSCVSELLHYNKLLALLLLIVNAMIRHWGNSRICFIQLLSPAMLPLFLVTHPHPPDYCDTTQFYILVCIYIVRLCIPIHVNQINSFYEFCHRSNNDSASLEFIHYQRNS